MLLLAMAGHIDHNRTGKDQDVVLVLRGFDAIGIPQREPFLRYSRRHRAVSRKRVLVLKEIALGLQIVWSRYVDRKPAVKECEQLLPDRGPTFALSVDVIGRSPGKQFLFDEREFPAI